MTTTSPKIRAARVSVGTAASLATLKLVTGVLTGSLAVVASAIDSLLDILMSAVNYLSLIHISEPTRPY